MALLPRFHQKLQGVCSLAILSVIGVNTTFAGLGDVWSMQDDFSITNGNPNVVGDGAWEYHSGAGPNLMDEALTDHFSQELPGNTAWHRTGDAGWVTIAKINQDYTEINPTGCNTGCPQMFDGDVGGHGIYSIWWQNTSGAEGTYDISLSGYNTRNDLQEMGRAGNLDVTWNDVEIGMGALQLHITDVANDRVEGTPVEMSATGIRLADQEYIKATMNYGDWSGLTFDVTQSSGSTPSPDKTWKKDASNDWNVKNNWQGGIPDNDSGDEVAVMGDVITEARTVFTDANVSVKGIQFVNPNRYVIAGTGSVTLDTTTSTPGAKATIDVILGNHEFQAPVALADDTDVTVASGSLSFINQLDLGGKTLNKLGSGEMAIRSDLITAGGGTINVAGGTVSGNGTVSGDLDLSGGLLAPGNSGSVSAVPEPTGLVLLILAVLSCGLAGRNSTRLQR